MIASDFNLEEEPLYTISVAAKLAGVHPQTLRLYEKVGILKPKRTSGNIRLYSLKDIQKTKEARRIIKKYGTNISAVKFVLELEEEVERLRIKVKLLEEKINQLQSQTSESSDE